MREIETNKEREKDFQIQDNGCMLVRTFCRLINLYIQLEGNRHTFVIYDGFTSPSAHVKVEVWVKYSQQLGTNKYVKPHINGEKFKFV